MARRAVGRWRGRSFIRTCRYTALYTRGGGSDHVVDLLYIRAMAWRTSGRTWWYIGLFVQAAADL